MNTARSRHLVASLAVLMSVAVCAGRAGAEPVTTIRANGPTGNRVDLVILGDGFTAAQIASGAYAAEVEAQVQRLFGEEPYREYAAFFNVHRVDVTSAQAGSDHPELGVFVDTALDGTYNCSNIPRLICVSTTNVNAVIARSAIPANARDIVLVLVNDTEYGGSGGAIAVASLHASATELVLHETGHTFAQLADEYTDSPPACQTSEPSSVNATRETRREFLKWRHWVDPGTPIPTTGTANGIPGLYQGAVYCVSGAYRPTFNSKMRSLGRPFEQINTEQHVRRIYNLVSPIDSFSPTASSVTVVHGVPNPFSVTVPVPRTHTLSITWFVNGVLTTTGPTFSSEVLPLGTHHVEARVQDSTGLVRSDPASLLSETHAWDVTVQAGATSVPTFLQVVSIVGNTVTLAWTAPTAFTPGYIIEGGVGPQTVQGAVPANGTATTHTFIAPTGAFYVRVHALNGAARSGASNEIRIFVNVPAPPEPPSNLLGGGSGSTVVLAWQNAAAGGRPTNIVLDVSGSLTTSLALPATEGFVFANVPAGTYTLTTRAVNSVGASLPSNPVTLTFPITCTPPATPINLTTSRQGNAVTVSWNLPPTGSAPTGFVLSVTGAYVGSFPVATRSLSAVAGPGTYVLSVVATGLCGSSAPSPSVTLVVP